MSLIFWLSNQTTQCSRLSFTIDNDILDVAGAPGTPRGVETSEDSITISWTKPRHDGGSPITGYIVEKRIISDDHWTKASHALCPDTTMK